MEEVVLAGCHTYVRKIEAIKLVRDGAGVSLKVAKKAIDDCIRGEQPRLQTSSQREALNMAKKLATIGVMVRIRDQVFDDYPDQLLYPTYQDRQIGVFKVHTISDLATDLRFTIAGDLISGTLSSGDLLAIPINATIAVSVEIAEVFTPKAGYILNVKVDEELDYWLWHDLDVIADDLLVLTNSDT